jgi:hypothetical protein
MFMYGYPDWGFSVLFPQLWDKCQGKTRKDGARPALFLIFVLFCVFFVFYVFLCYSMYWLFCDVLCIVDVYMCTVLLPLGGYPIAVKYIISYKSTIHRVSGISSHTKMLIVYFIIPVFYVFSGYLWAHVRSAQSLIRCEVLYGLCGDIQRQKYQ